MLIRNKEALNKYPQIADAITLSETTNNTKFVSMYVDKSYELAVKFAGKLDESQVKNVIMHLNDIIDGDTDIDAINPEYGTNYTYYYMDGDVVYTDIYSTDGYNYKNFLS